jgi:NAD(P)-dependent dehydrogenase (short-subunit alcohol dehydrogenase family)
MDPIDVDKTIAMLEAMVEDRTKLADISSEDRRRLLIAAGRLSRPERGELRQLRKAIRKNETREERAAVQRVLERTGIRKARQMPFFVTPPQLTAGEMSTEAPPVGEVGEDRKCYVCKRPFREVHHFYDQMCAACATLNWERRNASADLRGRVAIVTGSRVKIGYHAAIKLLRAGARVIATTRFPRDSAARYAREPDFTAWRDRLTVVGLDLRHTPSVEAFCAELDRTLDRLDFILNNACQTVRRPPGFYRHLVDAELAPPAKELTPLLALNDQLHASSALARREATIANPVALSQVALLPEELREDLTLFPAGKLDADMQQVDLRGRNSWRLLLHEVSTVELLEVQLVNAIAPYVLNGRLRALMNRVPSSDKHIVNVSAMEGQFYRAFKTDKHPHTNMAKAALNMMTRTAAADYVKDGIHMNSVDTGWITDEDPVDIATRKTAEHGFSPPLDVVDGAARIVDPIFDGFRTGDHKFGLFLKDYVAVPW